MGRIKNLLVRKIAKRLLEEHGDIFTTDFEKNKEIVKKFVEIKSKKIRNVVAGYITSFKKRTNA